MAINMECEVKIQGMAGNLVADHVYQCQTSLVFECLENETHITWDEVENKYEYPEDDTEIEPVIEWMKDMGYVVPEKNEDWDDDEYLENLVQDIKDNSIMKEVYEWWLVSGWLCSELVSRGETVLTDGMSRWWGRCCTGQAIKLDCVIQEIALNTPRYSQI